MISSRPSRSAINYCILLVSIAVSVLGLELYLRMSGRYHNQVTNRNVASKEAIWDRLPNTTEYREHPDLGYDIPIITNDFQARSHTGENSQTIKDFDGEVIGFFGDSFTENRAVEDVFTFTSILQSMVDSRETRILNFGVDGYGMDQSFIKYRNFDYRNLDYVFYVFVGNDLRNLYENQIFRFEDEEIFQRNKYRMPFHIKVLRQLHVTYFFIESYFAVKTRFVEQPSYSKEEWEKRLLNVFIEKELSWIGRIREERHHRFHDEYADSMVTDLLSDNVSEETALWANNFRALLKEWDRTVGSRGGQFAIIVLPTYTTTAVASELFAAEFPGRVFFLRPAFDESWSQYRFVNDGHWNERGNLVAAATLARWGDGVYWRIDKPKYDDIVSDLQDKIGTLYSTKNN